MSEEDNVEIQNSQSKNENRYQEKEAAKRAKQLEQLNDYVNQMAYKPINLPLVSERTEHLAEVQKRNIVGTYIDHKNNLSPKERSERVGRIVAKSQPITTEQLSDIIHQHRQMQAKSEEIKKKQNVLYHQTLTKLQNQCKEQVMNSIVRRFAREVVKRATTHSTSNLETESFQRLQKSLLCNMFLALNVPNEDQSQDYMVYNKLANVLANMLLQALFLAQSDDNQTLDMGVEENNFHENKEKDRCIQLRTLRAAKKKVLSQMTKKF